MRIAVIGPQNTGKSTFITDMLSACPSYTTPGETYRDLVKKEGLAINRKTTEASQRAIRDFLYEQITHFKGEQVLFDRCLIDNWVYTKAQSEAGSIPAAFVTKTEALMHESLQHLDAFIFIPTAVGVSLIDDFLRDTDRHFVDKVNELFIEKLLALRCNIHQPIVVITGTREERVRRAKAVLGIR